MFFFGPLVGIQFKYASVFWKFDDAAPKVLGDIGNKRREITPPASGARFKDLDHNKMEIHETFNKPASTS